MNVNFVPFIRPAGFLAGAMFIFTGAPARGADRADAFPNFDDQDRYIKISGQTASITGNKAAFQNRTGQPAGGGAGLEDLHLSKDVSKTTTVVIDGRALLGAEDYLGRFKVARNEVGSLDVGYKRFRTFYDGAGGFFPLSNQWSALAEEDLHIDRGKFWAEATLALPDAPVLTLRYTNELRSGKKDSTIWGDTDFTGLPNNNPPVSQVRKIVPSFIKVRERHETLEATVSHVIRRTTVQLTLLGDRTNNRDTRFVTRFPGEARPFPAPAATVLLPAAQMNNQVLIVEVDGMKTKTSGLTLKTDTVLTDKLRFHLGGNYELIHTEISGNRPLVTSTPAAGGVVPVTTNNYSGLTGGTRLKNYTGSIALDYQPVQTLFVKLALRAQDEFIRGASSYDVIAASGTPATTLTTTPRVGWARIHQNVQTPVVELRYTGIRDLALYFNGSRRRLHGEEHNTSAYNPLTATAGTLANNHVSEEHGNYTFGANWRPSSLLTLRGEVFHKDHQDNTVGFGSTLGDYYLLDSQYTGYKLTALARPSAQFAFTTRFISQHATMRVTGFLPTFPAYDSLNARNCMIGETVDWTPGAQCYVQLNANAVFNVINTVYPRAGTTPASGSNAAFDTNQVLQNSDNNYVTGSVLTGFVLDRKTDLQFQVNYYRAKNGNAILAPLTQPYGVAVRDVSATVGVKRKFSDRLVGNARIGYFESKNDTSGGFASYHGPVAYLAFEQAF